MQDITKKLSRSSKEAERAAALRENLKKRKAQGAGRDTKNDGDNKNDANTEDSHPV